MTLRICELAAKLIPRADVDDTENIVRKQTRGSFCPSLYLVTDDRLTDLAAVAKTDSGRWFCSVIDGLHWLTAHSGIRRQQRAVGAKRVFFQRRFTDTRPTLATAKRFGDGYCSISSFINYWTCGIPWTHKLRLLYGEPRAIKSYEE